MTAIVLRPDDERWFSTVDAAIRYATRPTSHGIDYRAESLRDNGWSGRQALLLRLAVLACLNSLEERQREALILRAHDASIAGIARELRVGRVRVRAWIDGGRQAVALRLRSCGLMAPS